MKKLTRELVVTRLEDENPYIRVTGHFYEGGDKTSMSFLCSEADTPWIGSTVDVTIKLGG